MPELEQMLRALGQELDYPATPAFDLRPAPRSVRACPPRRILAFAIVALLLAAAAGAATVIELPGVTIHRVERLPAGLPGPGEPRPLGREVTLAEARGLVGFEPLTPAAPPRSVHYSALVRGGAVTLVYPDVQITQFLGHADRELVTKLATMETRVDQFEIDGERALWIEGAPHAVYLRDAAGWPIEETLRLAGNVLLVDRGGLLVRIEGDLSRGEAVALARSLR